jgi:hypothetical protein
MENVRQVIVPIVLNCFCEKIFYLYVSFYIPFSIKIVSQNTLILHGLSEKLVTRLFPTVSFMKTASSFFRNAPTLALSLSLSLLLFACFPFFLF